MHIVIISVDAMVFEDLEYLKTLPAFSRLLDGAAIIERVRTIYPSLTHPVHASILTGAPAGITGITSNHTFDRACPDGDGRWYNELSDIRCDTLIHAAKRAGLTVAAATWPLVSKCEELVDYLVPSAMNYDFEGRDEPLDAYRELGASDEMMEIIAEGVRRFGIWNKHPEYSALQAYCAAEIIKKYKPGLLLVHPGDVDSKRHSSGVWGNEVRGALRRTDEWLGEILDAIDECGITDDTDVIVMSDHGQINTVRNIAPNVWLAERGLIRLDECGRIESWDAYVKSAGGSAHVYLSRPEDSELYGRVYDLLCDMANAGIYGFEKVYTEREMREKYGLYGDFSFVLETDGYTGFSERVSGSAVSSHDMRDYRTSRGTHGHEPHKGPQPPFIGKGPSFIPGARLAEGDILNHAPTIAAIFGGELYDACGSAVYEILRRK